jgi:hypothetical protein
MRDDLQRWIFIIVFVIVPFLNWIVRKIAEARSARAPGAPGTGTRTLGERGPAGPAGAGREAEDEALDDWLDPAEWESVDEFEEERAPPPRRELERGPVREPARQPVAAAPVRPAQLPDRVPLPPLSSPPALSPPPRPVLPAEPRRAPAVVTPFAAASAIPAIPAAPLAAPLAAPRLQPEIHFEPAATGRPGGAAAGAFPRGIADLRQAVIWSEILGRPRALSAQEGPDPHLPPC